MKGIGQIERLKRLWKSESAVCGLYGGAFFQAFAGGMWLVSMPFVLKRLGGSDFEVGLCLGLSFAGYVATLALGQTMLDYFDLKRSTLLGAGTLVCVMAVMYLVVLAAGKGHCRIHAVAVLIVLSVVMGAMTVVFWPQVVGWLSRGYEGKELNRRLGIFNISWSSAGVVAPYVGGRLVESSSTAPLVFTAAAMAMSFLSIGFACRPDSRISEGGNGEGVFDDEKRFLHRRFAWMSRVALLISFVCIGLVRTQLALLFKFNLGFSESNYGVAIVIMNFVIFVVFLAATRTHAWHYVVSIFWGLQVITLLSMLMILRCGNFWVLTCAVGLIGVTQSFVYSSHLYYAISGARRRSGRMAIHEITLSIGIVAGSVIGGYLGDNFGRYAPYWFGLGVVAAGLLVQLGIWISAKKS